jgi:hypothetical protein
MPDPLRVGQSSIVTMTSEDILRHDVTRADPLGPGMDLQVPQSRLKHEVGGGRNSGAA